MQAVVPELSTQCHLFPLRDLGGFNVAATGVGGNVLRDD
jgi:hypothetical protein